MKLKIFDLTLFFVQHRLGWLKLLGPKILLMMTFVFRHLKPFLQLVFGKGEIIIFLLLCEKLGRDLVNLDSELYDFLIFQYHVFLVLLDRKGMLARVPIVLRHRSDWLLRMLECHGLLGCIHGRLVDNLDLFSQLLLLFLKVLQLMHLGGLLLDNRLVHLLSHFSRVREVDTVMH